MPGDPPTPVDLFFRESGQGPPIVLVHGLGGDHTVWNDVIPRLATDHRVVAPDLRGHGRTPAPPGSTFAFPELEADLTALLDRLQLPTVHLVGLSAGGLLSLRYALDSGQRLRTLIVIGASSHVDAHTRAVVERWSETFDKEGYDAYILRLLKDLFYPDWMEAHLEYADRLRAQQRSGDGHSVVKWGLAMRSFDLRGKLGKLRTPTLVVQGGDDVVVDAAHGRLLRLSIPGAELKILAQTGHMVPIERPAETASAIREWVARAESRSTPPGPT